MWSLSCLLQVVWWDQSGWSPLATSWPQTTTRRLCMSWASKTCRWLPGFFPYVYQYIKSSVRYFSWNNKKKIIFSYSLSSVQKSAFLVVVLCFEMHNTDESWSLSVWSQMVFVSLGAPRRERKGEGIQLPASCLPPPQKEHIPMLLLLQEPHLTTLFDLLEMLACFKPPSANNEKVHENPEVSVFTCLHTHTHK